MNDRPSEPSDALTGEVRLARRSPSAVRRRQSAPAPAVTRAVAAVAAGAALQLGMSVLGRRMARSAASSAVRMLVPARETREKKPTAIEPVRDEGPTVVVTETMIYRRVIIRRD